MHRKTGEMVYSNFIHTAITVSKLQLSLNNVKLQLNLEKISSLAKVNRIKYLEEMVIKASFDPTNSKSMEEIIKKKNFDIASLRNKLKLPAIEDP